MCFIAVCRPVMSVVYYTVKTNRTFEQENRLNRIVVQLFNSWITL